MTLRDLAQWALSEQTRLMAAPAIEARVCGPDYTAGQGSTDVVYRQGRYQIERIRFGHPTSVPIHRHPNLVTYELYVSGGGEFLLRGHRIWLEGAKLKRLSEDLALYLPSTSYHGLARTSPEGLCIMSVQEWNRTPTSVLVDWEVPSHVND